MVSVTELLEYAKGVKMVTGEKFVKINAEKTAKTRDVRKQQGCVKTIQVSTMTIRRP